jgi:hypothetical protein
MMRLRLPWLAAGVDGNRSGLSLRAIFLCPRVRSDRATVFLGQHDRPMITSAAACYRQSRRGGGGRSHKPRHANESSAISSTPLYRSIRCTLRDRLPILYLDRIAKSFGRMPAYRTEERRRASPRPRLGKVALLARPSIAKPARQARQ